jgi:hypothetical protein
MTVSGSHVRPIMPDNALTRDFARFKQMKESGGAITASPGPSVRSAAMGPVPDEFIEAPKLSTEEQLRRDALVGAVPVVLDDNDRGVDPDEISRQNMLALERALAPKTARIPEVTKIVPQVAKGQDQTVDLTTGIATINGTACQLTEAELHVLKAYVSKIAVKAFQRQIEKLFELNAGETNGEGVQEVSSDAFTGEFPGKSK